MTDQQSALSAIELGTKKAMTVLEDRKIARAKRADVLANHTQKYQLQLQMCTEIAPTILETAGFLVAAGDSWFDYPFHDVLKLLDDEHGYNVESSAKAGEPIETMAYQGAQLEKFARCVEKIKAQGATPKAILLSGGGDDLAGKEFGMLLNNAKSKIAGWNDEVVDGVLQQRILDSFKAMITSITYICKESYPDKVIPVLIHGYDYPVPDGRGYLWLGPWLYPGFQEKLFTQIDKNVTLMQNIIDRFNKMLDDLTQEPEFKNVRYINLRGTLSTNLENNNYQEWWDNELHPTKQGFSKIANIFSDELRKL